MKTPCLIFDGDPQLYAVSRNPTPEEQEAVDAYGQKYQEAMQREPHGLHFLVLPGHPRSVGVWMVPASEEDL